MTSMKALSYRELSHILAVLRYVQENAEPEDLEQMAHFLDCEPLSTKEVDALCERMNTGAVE